jgi:hypothetical protein
MGTWGTGPLDSDNALDMVDVIAFDPSRYREVILARLLPLMDRMFRQPGEEDDPAEDMQGALAACAVVADVRHQEHFYTSFPDDPEDFRVESADPQEDLEALAREVLVTYRKMEKEILDLGWRCSSDYRSHRAHLMQMETRLG